MSPKIQERGFTLIELLVTVVTLMVLAGIGVQTFRESKEKAAYTVADGTLRDARTALEAAYAEPDIALAPVNASQTSPGSLTDASANALLSGLRLPKNVKFQVFHEPSCYDASCIKVSMQVNHCAAHEHVTWTRFGDDLEILQPHVSGGGCS